MPETPKYLIRQGSYIEGIGVLAREGPEEHSLPYPRVNPRNSWVPLNEAAHEAFRLRNAKILARQQAKVAEIQKHIEEAKAGGAVDAELAGMMEQLSQLRVELAQLPLKLKTIPSAGPPSQYTYSDSTPIETDQSPAALDESIERLVDAARAGGASEHDIKTMRAALSHPPPELAVGPGHTEVAAAAKAAANGEASKPAAKPKRASDSA